ncbi:NERD domain-containing protein [Desemzia sp. RIT804]|uniref:nuclease-related domain-containing protein n=1 Tax=Desemzia sp. RIT 804 TaxID=2810209 RepID=UPI00194E0E7C|nr:nuclease-related domain-containing protein [Desemzia sp. RIT 804]MBM6615387.1 NERD domain-containing protein [Desemzia sp. RIT 804]
MAYKERGKSYNLLMMESLSIRMELTLKQQYYYRNLLRGYKGECKLDQVTVRLNGNFLVLNDLPLLAEGRYFQIDTLIIGAKSVSVYEAKNYGGEYIFKGEDLFVARTNKLIHTPFNQLDRLLICTRQVLAELGFHLPVNGFVAFMDPDMCLYQAPYRPELLLSCKLDKHFANVASNGAPLSSRHQELAFQLCERIAPEPPYKDLPKYTYASLTKGVPCAECGSFIGALPVARSRQCTCEKCGHQEPVVKVLCRVIEEYRRLFPDNQITTTAIYDWCGGLFTKKRIRRVLESYFQAVGTNRLMTYI